MTLFFKVCAGVLLAVILCLLLGNQGREMALLLTLAVGAMVLTAAVRYLEPVAGLLRELESVSGLDTELVGNLLRCAGVGLVGEVASLVCQDSGNSSLAKSIQILTSAGILFLCVPLFTALLELLRSILGEL